MDALAGRVAVVTGAASGIGLALSRRFSEEGMRLVLADIDGQGLGEVERELRGRGVDVLARRTDVARASELAALADEAFARFGKVHVLCNNAGVGGAQGNLWELSEDDWEWVLSVNLRSVIHGIRAFLPRMLAGGEEGHVVNTASVAGLVLGNGPYGVAKHGVVALSESLLGQLQTAGAPIGVTVLCPGWVNTRLHESGRHRQPEFGGPVPEEPATPEAEERRRQIARLLAGGFAPEEIADAVVAAIREGRFYLITAQPGMEEAIVRRHRAIEEGKLPPPPGLLGYGLREVD